MELVKAYQETTQIVGPPTLEDAIDAFISGQDVRQNSRRVYRQNLKQFFTWVDLSGYDVKELTRVHLLEYKEQLLKAGKSTLTVSSYLSAVRRFYEWAEANRFSPNIAKGVKSPRRRQQFRKQPLSVDQTKTLLNATAEAPGERTKVMRDYAIINLMVRTGLRTIEVIRANVEDIQYKSGKRILVVQGKGYDDKDNFVQLTDKAYKPISDYLQRRNATTGPMFISTSNKNKGQRLTTRTISYVSKTALRMIMLNEKYFTAHSLRHTAAVNILRAGGTLQQAQETLRHQDPATTQIYTHTIREEMRLKDSGEALLDNLF